MTSAVNTATPGRPDGTTPCWCCGASYPESEVVRLGSRPEVAVCLGCAHALHQQARAREDERRPSVRGRLRDLLRAGRRVVVARGWHERPLVGRLLRWLGRRLP